MLLCLPHSLKNEQIALVDAPLRLCVALAFLDERTAEIEEALDRHARCGMRQSSAVHGGAALIDG